MAFKESGRTRAWLVCCGNFVILFLETGMVKALGVLLPVLQYHFTTKTWIIGSIISLVPGIGAVTCPIGGALSKRFSARLTVMTFSLLCGLGFIIGSTASSVQMLLGAFLLTGFSMGSGGVITSELARHFDNNFNVANTIARTGLSSGLIVMPLLIQLCVDEYGWRGTLLLLGGMSLQCIVAGALLKPISPKNLVSKEIGQFHEKRYQELEDHQIAESKFQQLTDLNEGTSVQFHEKQYHKLRDHHISESKFQDSIDLEENVSEQLHATKSHTIKQDNDELNMKQSQNLKCETKSANNPAHGHIPKMGYDDDSNEPQQDCNPYQDLNKFSDQESGQFHEDESHNPNTDKHAVIHIGANNNSNIIQLTTIPVTEQNKRKKCATKVMYYLDLELFQDFVFITRMIYIFGCGYCNTGWLIYLVPFAISLGIPPYESALLATFGGIGQLVGTVIFPFLNQKLRNTSILYLTSVLMSVSLALNPLFALLNSYIGLICSAVGFGLGRGSGLLANLQIAKENTRPDKMSNVFTWLNVAYAVGSISSGFLSGWIYDQTGNYTLSFLVLGAVAILTVSPQLCPQHNINVNTDHKTA